MATVTPGSGYTRVQTTPDAAGRALDVRIAADLRSIQKGRVSLIFLTDVNEAHVTPDDVVEMCKELLKYAVRARKAAQR